MQVKYKTKKLWNPFCNYTGFICFGVFVCDEDQHTAYHASDLLKNYFDSNARYNKNVLVQLAVFSQLKMHR